MTSRTSIAVAVLLLAPSGAAAKEVSRVSVCGASACTTLTQKDTSDERLHLFAESRSQSAPPEAAAPWYRVKVTVRAEGDTFSFTQAYVPSAKLQRSRGEGGVPVWSTVPHPAVPLLNDATRGLEPLPASRLTGLDVRPPEAQVSEVFWPAREDGTPWPWIAAGLAVLAAGGALLRLSPRCRSARTGPGWPRRDTAANHRSGT